MLDETSVVSLAHRQHVEQCADCRVELDMQRAVRASIRVLRAERIEPPADLLVQLYADLRRYAASPSRRLARLVRVAPYVGGVLAAGAAGAVLAGRTRRTRFGII
ncbi:MAG TPA: hypothetical protein VM282_10375 [Acidimicrobiales bacterium]|nr:hypothetical protein [Acidimicrobiales bacterium]